MTISRRTASSLRARETVVLFSVADCVFAIAARAVDEIREIRDLKEFSSRVTKVKHTIDRQGHCYFVVDAASHFRTNSRNACRLMILRHAPIAVMVDAIDRMQEIKSIHQLPPAFSGEERTWYRGLTLIKGRVVPVVNPESFLSKAEVTLLNAALQGKRQAKAVAVTA